MDLVGRINKSRKATKHTWRCAVKKTFYIPCLIAIAIIVMLTESACGGDPACDNGSCDQGPDDAGTSGDNNPITGKDGGTPDSGDVTNSDAGSDAGPSDPCKEHNDKLGGDYYTLKGDFLCDSGGGPWDRTCSTTNDTEYKSCRLTCDGSFSYLVTSSRLEIKSANEFTTTDSMGGKMTCVRK